MTFSESAAGGLLAAPSTALQSDYPAGAAPVSASSGGVANAAAIATLPALAGKTTYIAGFVVTGTGATLGLAVAVTLVGIVGGTATFVYAFAVGITLANSPLIVTCAKPIPANAPNTPIVLTCPAGGLGAGGLGAVAYGYQL